MNRFLISILIALQFIYPIASFIPLFSKPAEANTDLNRSVRAYGQTFAVQSFANLNQKVTCSTDTGGLAGNVNWVIDNGNYTGEFTMVITPDRSDLSVDENSIMFSNPNVTLKSKQILFGKLYITGKVNADSLSNTVVYGYQNENKDLFSYRPFNEMHVWRSISNKDESKNGYYFITYGKSAGINTASSVTQFSDVSWSFSTEDQLLSKLPSAASVKNSVPISHFYNAYEGATFLTTSNIGTSLFYAQNCLKNDKSQDKPIDPSSINTYPANVTHQFIVNNGVSYWDLTVNPLKNHDVTEISIQTGATDAQVQEAIANGWIAKDVNGTEIPTAVYEFKKSFKTVRFNSQANYRFMDQSVSLFEVETNIEYKYVQSGSSPVPTATPAPNTCAVIDVPVTASKTNANVGDVIGITSSFQGSCNWNIAYNIYKPDGSKWNISPISADWSATRGHYKDNAFTADIAGTWKIESIATFVSAGSTGFQAPSSTTWTLPVDKRASVLVGNVATSTPVMTATPTGTPVPACDFIASSSIGGHVGQSSVYSGSLEYVMSESGTATLHTNVFKNLCGYTKIRHKVGYYDASNNIQSLSVSNHEKPIPNTSASMGQTGDTSWSWTNNVTNKPTFLLFATEAVKDNGETRLIESFKVRMLYACNPTPVFEVKALIWDINTKTYTEQSAFSVSEFKRGDRLRVSVSAQDPSCPLGNGRLASDMVDENGSYKRYEPYPYLLPGAYLQPDHAIEQGFHNSYYSQQNGSWTFVQSPRNLSTFGNVSETYCLFPSEMASEYGNPHCNTYKGSYFGKIRFAYLGQNTTGGWIVMKAPSAYGLVDKTLNHLNPHFIGSDGSNDYSESGRWFTIKPQKPKTQLTDHLNRQEKWLNSTTKVKEIYTDEIVLLSDRANDSDSPLKEMDYKDINNQSLKKNTNVKTTWRISMHPKKNYQQTPELSDSKFSIYQDIGTAFQPYAYSTPSLWNKSEWWYDSYQNGSWNTIYRTIAELETAGDTSIQWRPNVGFYMVCVRAEDTDGYQSDYMSDCNLYEVKHRPPSADWVEVDDAGNSISLKTRVTNQGITVYQIPMHKKMKLKSTSQTNLSNPAFYFYADDKGSISYDGHDYFSAFNAIRYYDYNRYQYITHVETSTETKLLIPQKVWVQGYGYVDNLHWLYPLKGLDQHKWHYLNRNKSSSIRGIKWSYESFTNDQYSLRKPIPNQMHVLNSFSYPNRDGLSQWDSQKEVNRGVPQIWWGTGTAPGNTVSMDISNTRLTGLRFADDEQTVDTSQAGFYQVCQYAWDTRATESAWISHWSGGASESTSTFLNNEVPLRFTIQSPIQRDQYGERCKYYEVVDLNDPPIALDLQVNSNEDEVATFQLSATDADLDPLTFSLVQQGKKGVAVISSSGLVTFTPNANQNGTDTFTFRVNDGKEDSNMATVTITIKPVNDLPTAKNQTITIAEDSRAVISMADIGFTDVDGDEMDRIQISTFPIKGQLRASGVAVLSSNPSVSRLSIQSQLFRFDPVSNEFGNPYAVITYRVHDGTALSLNTYQITIIVTPVNDRPTSSNQAIQVMESTPYSLSTANFPFFDVDGDTLRAVKITSVPKKGVLMNRSKSVKVDDEIAVSDIISGQLIYQSNAGTPSSLFDSFEFVVYDGAMLSNGSVDFSGYSQPSNQITVSMSGYAGNITFGHQAEYEMTQQRKFAIFRALDPVNRSKHVFQPNRFCGCEQFVIQWEGMTGYPTVQSAFVSIPSIGWNAKMRNTTQLARIEFPGKKDPNEFPTGSHQVIIRIITAQGVQIYETQIPIVWLDASSTLQTTASLTEQQVIVEQAKKQFERELKKPILYCDRTKNTNPSNRNCTDPKQADPTYRDPYHEIKQAIIQSKTNSSMPFIGRLVKFVKAKR